ncbi:MAG: hypothetical protein P1V20_04510 [Verrucomicrobiales bacterium]|nr:hypothetical protein [Verrucomicrobiales bacterium]
MKHSPYLIFLLFFQLLPNPAEAGKIPGGLWQITQAFDKSGTNQTLDWSFQLVDDGSATLIAVGFPVKENNKPVKNRTVGLLFIDIYDDGTLGGSLIEAYGNGKQSESSLDIDLSPDGQEINMAAFDRKGSITSRFKGSWLGKGLQSKMKTGDWQVREVVSPGKGSWDIEWNYNFKESDGMLSGRGNKAIVNGRKAYSGERRTYCQMEFKRLPENPFAIVGKGVETNYKGRKSNAAYEGWISPTGRTFFIMSYESEGLAALFIGRHSG